MKVSRVTNIRVNGEDHIRLFGYDENGNAIKQLKKFKNYVFTEDKNINKFPDNFKVEEDSEYIPYDYNIRPKTLRKMINSAPRSFYINDKIRKLSYQSDIKPELKYVLDNEIEFSRKRHIFFFDIETYFDIDDPDTNSDRKAIAPITSITAYSNLYKEYFVLYWHPTKDTGDEELIIEQKGNIGYYICKDEKVLLNTFCSMIKDFNIDIITGWYSHGYDVPYILKRLEFNFGSKHFISPVGNAWLGNKGRFDDYYKIRISGLDSIDMMEVVQKMNFNLQNNRLDTAAEAILGEEYGKLETASWKDWEDNLEGFLEYAVRDVELLVMMDDKLKLFEYLIQMQILSSITALNDIQSVTRLIDTLTIKKYWGRYIFPDVTRNDRVNFMGGLTIDPISGVHHNVNVYDFASLYPTTIIGYNISPETFLFSEEELGKEGFERELKFLQDNDIEYFDTGHSDELFGKRYVFMSQSEKVGVIPELSKELYQLRKEEKIRAETGKTEDERLVADKRQYAIKIILNSIYGAMGFNFFRLFVPECADTITFMSRTALKYAMDSLTPYGTVLYADTDSCFLSVDENKEDSLELFLNEFNENKLFDLIESFNPGLTRDFYEYELEHEKSLSHLYLGDRKKRYYSIQQNGKKYIHGLNIIKKDTPKYIKEVLDDLCEKAVRNDISLEDLKIVYNNLHEVDYEKIAVHKHISKRFEDYKKTIPQHVKGALFANEHFDLQIRNSDSVFLFYINNFAQPDVKPSARVSVICLRKEDFHIINDNDKFEIDYMELMEKQFIQPLREFDKIELVGHIINEWCESHPDNYRTRRDGTYAFKKNIK